MTKFPNNHTCYHQTSILPSILDRWKWLAQFTGSQSGNLVGNSLVGICLTLPNLGFYGYSLNTLNFNIQKWESVIFSCDYHHTIDQYYHKKLIMALTSALSSPAPHQLSLSTLTVSLSHSTFNTIHLLVIPVDHNNLLLCNHYTIIVLSSYLCTVNIFITFIIIVIKFLLISIDNTINPQNY